MAKNYALQAEKRENTGKGPARSLRRAHKIPGIIYGGSDTPVKITLPAKELGMEYQKGQMYTTLCDLEVEGTKHNVLARDIQVHPVTDRIEHVDFLRVTPKTRIAVSVPVRFENEENSPGIQEKGTLNVVRYDVELVCNASNIPDELVADLTPFQIGDAIKISDVSLPEGAAPSIDDRDFTLATIVAPRRLEVEETEAEDGEAAEGEEGAEAAEGESAEGGEESGDES